LFIVYLPLVAGFPVCESPSAAAIDQLSTLIETIVKPLIETIVKR
jgi:hypothetical protein